MPPLRSSSITNAEFQPDADDDSTGELTLTFASGQSYTYSDVPLSVYEGLLKAGSAGSYFNSVIRDSYG